MWTRPLAAGRFRLTASQVVSVRIRLAVGLVWTGAIDASTSGGSVTALLLAQPQKECRLSTSGGSINVSLPKDAHLNLDASTSGGRVSTDFPEHATSDRHHRALRVPLNGGGPLLYLHTSGGGISVRRAN